MFHPVGTHGWERVKYEIANIANVVEESSFRIFYIHITI